MKRPAQLIQFLLFLIVSNLLIGLSFRSATASVQVDTSAYHAQRVKINSLLSERSMKFGQYDESLNARTGIFGFQTKRDIKNSNEILRQIVLNDNTIFKELKVLLDYKDLEVQQVQSSATVTSDRVESYKVAIKKLQDQNDVLRKQLAMYEKTDRSPLLFILCLLVIAVVGVYLFTKKLKIVSRT